MKNRNKKIMEALAGFAARQDVRNVKRARQLKRCKDYNLRTKKELASQPPGARGPYGGKWLKPKD
jgi:hypothetical protein